MNTNRRTFVAKTFSGLEPMLARELRALGAEEVSLLNRAVSFRGDSRMLYRANLWCRSALSILQEVKAFRFDSRESYYDQLRQIAWHQLFAHDKTIAVQALAHRSEVFDNTLFMAQLTKDAIVDHFRETSGGRPSVDIQNPQVRINAYVLDDRCVVSLDSSGDPLFKRGYRKDAGSAPINEVLAAGLIMLSEWDMLSPFLDPMCGSGTFSVEAAMMSTSMAPALGRKSFGFSHWKDFDPGLLQAEQSDARQKQGPVRARILASDVSGYMLDVTRQNVMAAGLSGSIRVQRNDFFALYPREESGWVLLNPPYGQRQTQAETMTFYTELGQTLKHRFAGFRACFITAQLDSVKHVGLKPRRKIPVFNGPLKCIFAIYDLFEGKRKEHLETKRRRRIGDPPDKKEG